MASAAERFRFYAQLLWLPPAAVRHVFLLEAQCNGALDAAEEHVSEYRKQQLLKGSAVPDSVGRAALTIVSIENSAGFLAALRRPWPNSSTAGTAEWPTNTACPTTNRTD